jgi:drug/metabolite transporter, DME family
MVSSTTTLAPTRAGVGLSCLVMSAALLGTGGLIGTLLSRDTSLSSVAIATYRLAIGGALIVGLLVLSGRGLPRGRRAWTRIAVVGGLAAVYQASYFAAVHLTSVSLATLIAIGATPVLVVAVEGVRGRRRPDAWMALTVGCALAGLALLVGLPRGGYANAALVGGVGLALVAAAGFATVTLVGSVPVPGLDALSTTGFAFTVGGLGLAPVSAVAAGGLRFDLSPTAVALLAALAVGPTAIAYTLYFRGLRTVAASTAAVVMVIEPLTGAGLAALLLHDRLGPVGAAGALLLAAAVVLASRAPGRA